MISKPDKEKSKGKEKEKRELIIIRRPEEEEHETHNSAWKVAHADFMTAMMAFFLIMWLINATDEETRKGISAYFNPVHLSVAQKGLDDETKPAKNPGKNKTEPEKKPNADKSGGTKGASQDASGKGAAAKGAGAEIAEGKSASGGAGKPEKDLVGFGNTGGGMPGLTNSAELTDAEIREQAAFHDPYSVLAQLAAAYSATRPGSGDTVVGDDRSSGLASGPAERDPFDPVYWQTTTGKPYKTDQPGAAGKTPQIPASSFDAAAVQAPGAQPPIPLPSPQPADSDSSGRKAVDPVKATPDKVAPDPVAATRQAARVLAEEVHQMLGPDLGGGGAAPQIKVEATDDGVVISLMDDADFSMFDVGSAIPNGKVVVILGRIADMLAKRPGPVIIRGFTDGRPFRSSIYDNWRLSAERAHMAYYMLVRGGLDETRISRIEGYADHSLKNDKDPNAAENRRIEILLERPQS